MLPEAAAADVCGDGVHDAEGHDALDRAGDDAEGEGVRVVFVPCLDIKGKEC